MCLPRNWSEIDCLEDQALIGIILGDSGPRGSAICSWETVWDDQVENPAQADWDEKSKEMAWEVLMKRHYYAVKKVLVSYAGLFSDLDDVLQISFFKAYRGLKNLKDRAKFRYWIRAIALNECREYISERNTFRQRENTSDVLVLPEVELAQKSLEAVENAAFLDELRSLVPERYWQVLLLRYFHGYSVKEVSDVLGISPGLVKWRTNRAKKLAKEFSRTIREE